MNYDQLAPQETVQKTVTALKAHGVDAIILPDGAAVMEELKRIIPAGSSVITGSSKTLEQIGFTDYLKENAHGWRDLHAEITAENDADKRTALRKQSSAADYYLGSVHAVTETGEYIVASNTASQIPSVAYSSPNPVLVVSTKKIVPSVAEGMKRLEDHVVPLENENMKQKYGMGTALNKILIVKGESPMTKRHVRMLLVQENLGF